jgi:pilus assembly protein CpaF
MTDLVARVRHRLVTGPGAGDLETIMRAESGGIVDDAVLATMREQVTAELTGAGPLEPLLSLPGVTDVLVNGPHSVWLDCGAGLQRSAVCFPDDAAVRRLAQRLAAAAGRRLDDALPYVDAALPDGTRLHAVLPPLCASTTVSLRVLARERHDLDDLVARGSMPSAVGEVLAAIVEARLAFLITGGTGSGKTTLLGSLLGLTPPQHRLVVIEDASELVIDHPHVVRLVTRAANVEGTGGVGLRELVRQALRMRPDRLVVGEFRGAEIVELLVALNTGHEGGAATMHANSAGDVPARLAALGALAALPIQAMSGLAGSALDVVAHLRRLRDGTRVVAEIGVLELVGTELSVRPVWTMGSGVQRDAGGLAALLAERGARVPPLLR